LKLTVITPSYNSAGTIRDTLQSIAAQDYPFVEHIIIDGHSTDGTLKIVSEYPHVSRMISAKDEGIYHAMNKGLGLATGDVIGILNSDDLYTSDQVLSQVAKVFEDESVDGCYADLQYVNPKQLDKISRTWKSGEFGPRSFYWGWMPPHPTVFLRKRVYDSVGKFNLTLRSAADYEFLLRVFLKNNYKFKYIPKTLVKMRTGGMSNASLRNRFRANREDRMAWELNGLKPYFFTLYLKPFRKIFQFLIK